MDVDRRVWQEKQAKKLLQSPLVLSHCLVHIFPVLCWPGPVSGGRSAPLTTCLAWLHDRCMNLLRSLAFDLKAAEKGGPHRQHWVKQGFSWGQKPLKKCSCKLWSSVTWVWLFQCFLSGKLLVLNPTCVTCTAIMSSDSGNVTFPFKSPGVQLGRTVNACTLLVSISRLFPTFKRLFHSFFSYTCYARSNQHLSGENVNKFHWCPSFVSSRTVVAG